MQTILTFLTELNQNNNREWFAEHKKQYEDARAHFMQIVDILILKIKQFDSSVDVGSAKECVFRIYKDTRFSKDKLPYKTNMGAYISKGGRKSPYAGYYVHIENDMSFAGGGIYCPDKDVLKSVREDIADDPSAMREILAKPEFQQIFPNLYGETLKTAPRGFDKNHPAVDLLRYKSYTVVQNLSNDSLLSGNFLETVLDVFQTQKPLNDYLNDIIEKSRSK